MLHYTIHCLLNPTLCIAFMNLEKKLLTRKLMLISASLEQLSRDRFTLFSFLWQPCFHCSAVNSIQYLLLLFDLIPYDTFFLGICFGMVCAGVCGCRRSQHQVRPKNLPFLFHLFSTFVLVLVLDIFYRLKSRCDTFIFSIVMEPVF
jgi:hypothetical protein